jgi:elongation factor Ts
VVASYVHSSVSDGLGKIGVLITLESSGVEDELKAFGRLVAMHVAAANPQALDAAALPAATVEREKGVLAAKAQGKPANVVDKIVESGLKTFYKEVCLLDQIFIHDETGKKSVAQAVKEAEAKVGAPIKLGGFVRFALGEGLERPTGDFGGEVAALAGTH